MEFHILKDKEKLDIPRIHKEVTSTYWGKERTWDETLMTIEKSICFGMFNKNGEQVAYARMMTDGLVFSYIMDVVVFDPNKGKGLGKKLVQYILDQPNVKKVNTVALKTLDAHSFYENLGFKKVGDSKMWMSIERVKYDQKMRLIPAIDIIDGKCVRLSKGDYSTKKVYNENPLEVAKEFEAHGIQYLHLVDLDGAKSKHIVNYKVLETIALKTSLQIDFGGGLKSGDDLHVAFESGAHQITGGSIAVKDRETFLSWVSTYGARKIILGADANNEKVAVSGWQEESDLELIPFVQQYQSEGIEYVICTDISKDGMLQGPAFDLYQKMLAQTKKGLNLIASGGVSTFDELPKLAEIGCEGTIIGKAIYEGKISLKQLEQYILKNG